MKRVVITGGTGFVGANLARRLLSDGFETHLLVRPGYAPWRIREIQNDVQIHEVRLQDTEALTRLMGEIRPQYCFHLAVYGAYASQQDFAEMANTNILATAALTQACASSGCEAFVNTGSSSEYGFKPSAPKEDEELEPNSTYSLTKGLATHLVQLMARSSAMRISTLRLYSAYGPYEEPSRLIPKLLTLGLDKKYPPLANPDIARDFVYVTDVCDAFISAATKPVAEKGAVYNVGSGTQTTLKDIVDAVKRILHIPTEPEWGSMQARAWDTNVWVSDSRKIEAALGWKARVSLDDGLSRFADWFRANPEMLRHYRETA